MSQFGSFLFFLVLVGCVVFADITSLPAEHLLLTDLPGIALNSVHNVRNLVKGDKSVADLDLKDALTGCLLLVAVFVGSVLFRWIYQLLFRPMNRIRLLGDVGYIPEGGVSKGDLVKMVQKRRIVGKTPPPYPNGWFSVMESRDINTAEAKSVSVLGKNLAVFRGEDGKAHIIDAYCPHMGANLGTGGIVKGSCLECPFHGWQFRGHDGACVSIPYCEKKHIPQSAKVESYIVMERNGFIYMWNHADGNEPNWEPPEIPEISSGKWTYRGRTEHIVNAHIEEIPENGADLAHLTQVHSPNMAAGVDMRYVYSKFWSFAKHTWAGNWSQDEDDKHIGVLRLQHSVKIFGKSLLPLLDMDVTARQIGPGIVYLTFDSFFGKGAYLQSLTPVEPLTQRMIHHVYFETFTPTFIAKFFLLGEAMMVERDIMIWNNKKYEGRPLFVKSFEDSMVAKHRRWYSQFYPKDSDGKPRSNEGLDW